MARLGNFARGRYELKNPEKYIGTKTPTYRSSWEWHFMKMCDDHPAIQNGQVKVSRFLIEIP